MVQSIPEVPMSVEARMGVSFKRHAEPALCEPPKSPGGGAGAIPSGVRAVELPTTAAEIPLDGLGDAQLHLLKSRIEQRLSGSKDEPQREG